MDKKHVEKYIDEAEIFEKIKEEIYKLCPVKQPRVVFDGDGYFKDIEVGIEFYFYKEENQIVNTMVSINNMTNSYLVVGDVSNDTIGKLVAFLLNEFPYVNSVQTRVNGFEIEFLAGLEHFEQEGIGCNKISINFDTHPVLHKEFSELFQRYLNYIVSNFAESMSRAPQLRVAYKNYRAGIKKNIINSFSSEELRKFIDLMTDEERCALLIGMNTEKFFEVCDRVQKCGNASKGMVKELKRGFTTDLSDEK